MFESVVLEAADHAVCRGWDADAKTQRGGAAARRNRHLPRNTRKMRKTASRVRTKDFPEIARFQDMVPQSRRPEFMTMSLLCGCLLKRAAVPGVARLEFSMDYSDSSLILKM